MVPQFYSLFYVMKWCGDDSFMNRFHIAEGFKWSFITGIFINIFILVVIAVGIETFWTNKEVRD